MKRSKITRKGGKMGSLSEEVIEGIKMALEIEKEGKVPV